MMTATCKDPAGDEWGRLERVSVGDEWAGWSVQDRARLDVFGAVWRRREVLEEEFGEFPASCHVLYGLDGDCPVVDPVTGWRYCLVRVFPGLAGAAAQDPARRLGRRGCLGSRRARRLRPGRRPDPPAGGREGAGVGHHRIPSPSPGRPSRPVRAGRARAFSRAGGPRPGPALAGRHRPRRPDRLAGCGGDDLLPC